jgi:hypothetical protein
MMRRLPLLFVTAAAGRPNLQTGSARGVQTTSAHGVGRPRVTRNVSDTAGLHAAMDYVYVNEIVAASGTYRLADEPGMGCTAPNPYRGDYFLCIDRDLTIRAAAGATVVLDGGQKKGVVYVKPGVTAALQGLQITNGATAGVRPTLHNLLLPCTHTTPAVADASRRSVQPRASARHRHRTSAPPSALPPAAPPPAPAHAPLHHMTDARPAAAAPP